MKRIGASTAAAWAPWTNGDGQRNCLVMRDGLRAEAVRGEVTVRTGGDFGTAVVRHPLESPGTSATKVAVL